MKIEFTVLGNPKALKRHRTYAKDKEGNILKHPIKVDPSQNDKADFLAIAHQSAPEKPIKTAIWLSIVFYMPRPQNHYRTGKNEGEVKLNAPVVHTKNPDLSNLIKFIEDSLNGVFWHDDRLICQIKARKLYSDRPRTEIEIDY